jgi:glucose-6-phosphate dehydrogenase assembly protein OpcA
VLANRRITDSAQSPDPVASLLRRAEDFAAGDTDLAWTRTTPWRSLLASAMDAVQTGPTEARVGCEPGNPSAALLAGWLAARLNAQTEIEESGGPGITQVELTIGGNYRIGISRPDGRLATLHRGDEPDRQLPLPRRELGDLLAEELRRMDPDYVYADSLSAATKVGGLSARPASRTLVWRDPAWSGQGSS